MEKIFKDLCNYINEENQEEIQKIEESLGTEFPDYQKKAQKFIKNLKHKTKKLGYEMSFESFCKFLEDYINTKDNMTDDEKRAKLKILLPLSELYDINLRAELEKYITYVDKKEVKEPKENNDRIFKLFCIYNLLPDNNVELYNRIKQLCEENNIDYNETQKQSLMYVEEIKLTAEKLGYETDLDSTNALMDYYLDHKKEMNDQEKITYLRVLFHLCEVYEIDLRQEIINSNKNEKEDLTLDTLKESLLNPLDNEEALVDLLKQRLNFNSFNVNSLYSNTIEEKEYDEIELKANITYRLFSIFLDKFNNYAYNDLNQKYVNLITEEELYRLENLTKEEIYNILKEIDKGEQSHYICKKYNISNNLYTFILLSTVETIDLNVEHIGTKDNSLFNIQSDYSDILIHLNGPKYETNLILNEYIIKCIENNLNYDMKGLTAEKNSSKTIIYSSKNNLIQKLNILNKIINKNSKLIDKFQEPFFLSSKVKDTIYGLTNNGIVENEECLIPYDEYFNQVLELAYYRTISKIALNIIDQKEHSNILNFINLESPVIPEKQNLLSITFADIPFIDIKGIVEKYETEVRKNLNIYLNDKESEIANEFTKSIQYMTNIIRNKNKKDPVNIAIEL